MVGLYKRMDGCKVAVFAYLNTSTDKRLIPQDFLSDVFGRGVRSNNFTSIVNIKNPQEIYHYGKIRYQGRTYYCAAQCIKKDDTEVLVMVFSTKSERINREKAFKLFPSIPDSETVKVLRGAVHLELSSLPKDKIDHLKRVSIETMLKGSIKPSVKENKIENYILSH